jgi:nitrite reductase/ring-hydroxylating ferredoxin subunit
MLGKEDNATLTQVGPGTPMGEVFRRFWLPVMLPDELPSPDCPPKRLRVLSEDLIAFRDTSGRVGFIQNACPHRGASLFFGRNEEDGLRCVYHGWKFDVDGVCVDMPSEPAESNFKSKVRATAYPGCEWGGCIWIYMGPPELSPELPELEWAIAPPEHTFLRRWVHEVNYLQAFEGDIDTSHSAFLHRRFTDDNHNPRLWDTGPVITVKETDYGFVYGGLRHSPEPGQYYWRMTQWMLPTYSLIPSRRYPRLGHCYVPIDDEHTSVMGYYFNAERPLTDEERAIPASGMNAVPRIDLTTLKPIANRGNDYLIDREVQRKETFTGILGIPEQDMAVTQSMGPVYSRWQEHLGRSDLAIIHARRRLQRLAKEVSEGNNPYAAYHGEVYRVRSLETLSPSADLETVLLTNQEALAAKVGL